MNNQKNHDAKASAVEHVVSGGTMLKIINLRNMIERGYGRTGKPISQKRLKEMRKTLFNMEYEFALKQGNRYMKNGDVKEFNR